MAAQLGLGVKQETGEFLFPTRKIRHQYYKLQYGTYPTGYRKAAGGNCGFADTTSATRLLDVRKMKLSCRRDGFAIPTIDIPLQVGGRRRPNGRRVLQSGKQSCLTLASRILGSTPKE